MHINTQATFYFQIPTESEFMQIKLQGAARCRYIWHEMPLYLSVGLVILGLRSIILIALYRDR